MAQDLIIRQTDVPDEYLLAQVLRTIVPTPEFIKKFTEQISYLSASEQIKAIGGNIFSTEDKRRAELRTLKLINLGLEKAAEIKGVLDIKLAQAMVLQKPLSLMYAVGLKYFTDSKEAVSDLLEKSQIMVGDLWFCLISDEEFKTLKIVTELDYSKGIIKEHRRAIESAVIISRKLLLAPILPLRELASHSHWGSPVKGEYPTKNGVIDCFLLSLIIACLFRQEQELFDEGALLKGKRWWQEILKRTAKDDIEERSRIADALQYMGENIMFDALDRIYNNENSKERQIMFLMRILAVNLDEVKEFADLIFLEQEKFQKKLSSIEKNFIKFFLVAAETLRVKPPVNFFDIISYFAQQIVEKVQTEVKEFYLCLDDWELSKEAIMKFWDSRVSLKEYGIGELRAQASSEQALENINPAHLARQTGEYILRATGLFRYWQISDQEVFCRTFNPNHVLNEEKEANTFIRIMFNISGEGDIGWNQYFLGMQKRAELPASDVFEITPGPWVERIMDKIGWRDAHPLIISTIWRHGSDRMRDCACKYFNDIKVTLRALKDYYIFDHQDQRLLEHALRRLVNEDKVKSEKTWDDIAWVAQNLPRCSLIIEMMRAAEKKK